MNDHYATAIGGDENVTMVACRCGELLYAYSADLMEREWEKHRYA